MEQLRPRLTPAELNFIAKSLRTYEALMQQKQTEIEQRELRIKELRRKIINEGPYQNAKLLKAEREKLQEDKQQNYFRREWAAKIMAKRLEAMLNGRKLHSSNTTVHLLKNGTKKSQNS